VRSASVTEDWLDTVAARGQHVSREHGDIALLQAAIDVYEAEFVEERAEFFASAQRFRPRVRQEIGRVVEFRYRGHRYSLRVFRLSVEHYRIDVDAARVDVWVDPIAANVRTLTCGGSRYRVITATVGATHLIEVDGALHRISREAEGDIRALGPAVVVGLWVGPGDRVTAGQRVATLESMKMETDVLAPCDGTVRETSVMPNAQVGPSTRLLVIDPDEAGAAGDAAERVRFDGRALPPALGGRPASRVRAAIVGLRAFAGALTPPDLDHAHALLDDIRALMRGSDIDPVESRRLVDDYRLTCDRLSPDEPSLLRGEDEILEVFADISTLFRRQAGPDEADDPTALSTGQYFLTYLRTIEARGADLPPAFLADLQRALRHYGSDSLEVTNALKSRLFWMYKSHARIDQQVAAVLAILDRRLRHAPALLPRVGSGFMDVVVRLI
jgi:biotin carboxyl carrier protein